MVTLIIDLVPGTSNSQWTSLTQFYICVVQVIRNIAAFFLFFTYTIFLAHGAVPHCHKDLLSHHEHQPNHEHYAGHTNHQGHTDLHFHHKDHVDADFLELLICLFEETDHLSQEQAPVSQDNFKISSRTIPAKVFFNIPPRLTTSECIVFPVESSTFSEVLSEHFRGAATSLQHTRRGPPDSIV